MVGELPAVAAGKGRDDRIDEKNTGGLPQSMNLFLVLGPESSGNHITTELLITMGCFGDASDKQRLDAFVDGDTDILPAKGPMVLMRSVPHGRQYPDVSQISKRLYSAGYRMKTIIPVREWTAIIVSNYYHREETVEKAAQKLEEAWAWIGTRFHFLRPFFFFNVSLLFKDWDAGIRGLEWFTGLELDRSKMGRELEILDPDKLRHGQIKRYGVKSVKRRFLQC